MSRIRSFDFRFRSAGAALIAIAIACVAAQPAIAQSTGKKDYDDYCASCHGEDGKGHGKALYVIPQIAPPDLTQLSRKKGGKFPADEVYRSIDGRTQIPSHKRFDMPFWGVRFQQSGKEFTPESNAQVKRRLGDIVTYVESLQVK